MEGVAAQVKRVHDNLRGQISDVDAKVDAVLREDAVAGELLGSINNGRLEGASWREAAKCLLDLPEVVDAGAVLSVPWILPSVSCLSVWLSVCPSLRPSFRPSVRLPVCLSVCRSSIAM